MVDSDRNCRKWQICTFVWLLISVVLAIVLILGTTLKRDRQKTTNPECAGDFSSYSAINPQNPEIFEDLTPQEIQTVFKYLRQQRELRVVRPSEIAINASVVISIELRPPQKSDALDYLDSNGPKPERHAKVIIMRGDKPIPDIEEYMVGPLPKPRLHALQRRVSYSYRPFNMPEFQYCFKELTPMFERQIGALMRDSYGTSLLNCGKKCLKLLIIPVSSAIHRTEKRKFWALFNYDVDYYILHPTNLAILLDMSGKNTSAFHVEKVWYNGFVFSSLNQFNLRYFGNPSIKQIELTFPDQSEKQFSSLNRRGNFFPNPPQRRPHQVEPDGKRYRVRGHHVEYMGWMFDFRMSSESGPQLYDIRYDNERIVYELSLQEIAVFYSANNPAQRFSDFVDSLATYGTLAKNLVPGADCPEHSFMIPAVHYDQETENNIAVSQSAFCIFEQNTGIPLRRHHSYSRSEGNFYNGMMDDVLILRTIITVVNYDYIFDFVFHQNGAIEVRVISTGYIFGGFTLKEEISYGFQLHKNLFGPLHFHTFNFRVDLDIKGTSNRYETLDILHDHVDNKEWSPRRYYFQTKFQRNLKKNEKEAVYKYNFDHPKYMLFYNNNFKSQYGNPKAYRLYIQGLSKQMFSEDEGNEPAVSWARYQMAVTNHKENETRSSSMYAVYDAVQPTVNFTSFINEDEDIVDKDLVAWVTLGVHHIPHTEDLPITTTTGGHRTFFLLPYNYFDEDPAMGSGNAIRIDPHNKGNLMEGARINRYGISNEVQCIQPASPLFRKLEKNASLIFS